MICVRPLGLVVADRQPQLVRRERKCRAREVRGHEHLDAVGFEQALDHVGFDLRRRAEDDRQIAHTVRVSAASRLAAATDIDSGIARSPASNTTRPPTIVRTGRVSRISRGGIAKMSRDRTTRSASYAGSEHALAILGELGVGGPARVALDRLRQRDALFRKPAAGRRPVRELARHGRIEAEHRVRAARRTSRSRTPCGRPASTNDGRCRPARCARGRSALRPSACRRCSGSAESTRSTPSALNRARSSAVTTCACSMRGRQRRPPPRSACSRSRMSRTSALARSPIAWTTSWKPVASRVDDQPARAASGRG